MINHPCGLIEEQNYFIFPIVTGHENSYGIIIEMTID
jgi:hypothetical protein